MDGKMKKALDYAIKRERSAYKLYSHMCHKAKNANTEAMLRKLAIQELKHEALFREYLKTGDMIEAKTKISNLYYDENLSIVDELKPSLSTTGLRDDFLLAMTREKESVKLYTDMMNKEKDLTIKDIFFNLAKEEESHERLLRKEYAKIF